MAQRWSFEEDCVVCKFCIEDYIRFEEEYQEWKEEENKKWKEALARGEY